MFPALEPELNNNSFFKAWQEKSLFARLLGAPPILVQEFSTDWINEVRNIMGNGPLTGLSLANLASYIESVKDLEGYNRIKERLRKLDDRFFPTISELQFIDFILMKTPKHKVQLEYTFETVSGKHPELKVDYNDESVYFEVTTVRNYKEMSEILTYYNVFTAFQLSLKALHKISRGLLINFDKYPDEKILKNIYYDINEELNRGNYIFNIKKDNYDVEMYKGNEVKFNLPLKRFENKIKDKIDEETTQFDEGNINFIVIDVTAMINDLNQLMDFITQYLVDTENKRIWSVLLLSNRWFLGDTGPEFKITIVQQANSMINAKKALDICSYILPDENTFVN